ncbi:hypothetical protein AB9P05_24355 [Roseivirga sp. BDSF3-8]|uniref:hypothetical protein n=1 Tax=Roseivirga sp. BDSF3-8 TaxID=3241598 RepID=UPI0035321814
MGVYYYCYSPITTIFLPLGKKIGDSKGQKYSGPIIWYNGQKFQLNADQVEILIKKFNEKYEDSMILPDHELFESGKYLTEKVTGIEIGGDLTNDLSIIDCFPHIYEEDHINNMIKV